MFIVENKKSKFQIYLVHAESEFKSKFVQLNHENTKVIRHTIRDRKREQYEYERYNGLNMVHLNVLS